MEKKELTCDCNIIHKEAVDKAIQNKPEEKLLENLSQLFKILGDPTRIKILWTLDNNEMCVCDIANVLNMSKSAVSHQLAVLRKSNVVKCKRSGKEVYYTLDAEHVNKLFEIALEHISHEVKYEQ